MSDKVNISEKHERTYLACFSNRELTRILLAEVARLAGLDPATDLLHGKIEVRFEEETMGSPPYRVGTRAIITVTEQLGE